MVSLEARRAAGTRRRRSAEDHGRRRRQTDGATIGFNSTAAKRRRSRSTSATGTAWAEGFTGRWLAWDETTDMTQGIAITKGGQFAWYECVPMASRGELNAYASLDDLMEAVTESYGDDLTERQEEGLAQVRAMVGEAAGALGQEHVIWRDI
jgi:hypothetical protein